MGVRLTLGALDGETKGWRIRTPLASADRKKGTGIWGIHTSRPHVLREAAEC